MSKLKNKEYTTVMKFVAVLFVLLIMGIVVFIKIAHLDASIYIPLIMIINMSAVYLFWWKNKENRETLS